MNRWSLLLWIPLAAILLTAPAYAEQGPEAQRLIPLREVPVRLVTERVHMEYRRGEWSVRSAYVLQNETGGPLTFKAAFPQFRCPPHPPGCNDLRFRKLMTSIRGRRVAQRVGRVSKEWLKRISVGRDLADLDRAYVYDFSFAPHETVKVVQSYRISGTTDMLYNMTRYLAATGVNWRAPVRSAQFVVRIHGRRAPNYEFPADYRLVRYREQPPRKGRGAGLVEMVFEMANWTPRQNFRFVVWSHLMYAVHNCGGMTDSLAVKSTKELDQLPENALMRCMNLPYAIHGYPFRTPALRNYFYRRPRRVVPLHKLGDEPPPKPDYLQVGLIENPAYSRRLLNSHDEHYAKAFRKALLRRRRGIAGKPASGSQPSSPQADGAHSPSERHASAAVPQRDKTCGCGTSSAGGGLGFGLVLFLFVRRRRLRAG